MIYYPWENIRKNYRYSCLIINHLKFLFNIYLNSLNKN